MIDQHELCARGLSSICSRWRRSKISWEMKVFRITLGMTLWAALFVGDMTTIRGRRWGGGADCFAAVIRRAAVCIFLRLHAGSPVAASRGHQQVSLDHRAKHADWHTPTIGNRCTVLHASAARSCGDASELFLVTHANSHRSLHRGAVRVTRGAGTKDDRPLCWLDHELIYCPPQPVSQ